MLNEGYEAAMGSWLTIFVDDLQVLVDEWNSRSADAVAIAIEPPYDIPSVVIADSDGNRLDFQQPIDEAEQARRAGLRGEMRELVRARVDAGEPLPSPAALVEAAGRPLGIAIEVLREFSDG